MMQMQWFHDIVCSSTKATVHGYNNNVRETTLVHGNITLLIRFKLKEVDIELRQFFTFPWTYMKNPVDSMSLSNHRHILALIMSTKTSNNHSIYIAWVIPSPHHYLVLCLNFHNIILSTILHASSHQFQPNQAPFLH